MTTAKIIPITPAQQAKNAAAAKVAADKAAVAKAAAAKALVAKQAADKAAAAKVAAAKAATAKATAVKKVDAAPAKAVAKVVAAAVPANKIEAAQKQFIEWLRVKDPVLYNMALKRMARKQKMSGFLDIFKSVVDVVKDVGPKVVEMTNQKKILDAQIKAAQAGQAPLNIPYTPVVTDPNSAQAQNVINAGANYGMPATSTPFNRNLLLLGIPVLIGAWWFLRRKRR
jgi:hypothetical protein